MKPRFKHGRVDYALVGLTCLVVLLFFDRWNARVQNWLKETTQDGPGPEPLRQGPDRRNAGASGDSVLTVTPEHRPSPANEARQ